MIRRLTASDWEAYRSLRLEALRLAPEAFASDLSDQIGNPPAYWQSRAAGGPNSLMLGAFQESTLVGMAGLSREERVKTRHRAGVVSVYVSPDARRNGFGHQLIEGLIAAARQWHGVEQLVLSVTAENQAACQLYLHLGFRVYGTLPQALRIGDRYYDQDEMFLVL